MPPGKSKKRGGLKLNGTYQLLTYADDDYKFDDNRNTTKKNTEALSEDSIHGG
jgi:hypothetical protein